MVIKLFSDADNDRYKRIFYAINTKQDGLLTRGQLLQGYWDVGVKSMSEVELDRTLAYVDNDQNGFITFGEFLAACVDSKELLQKERVVACFKSFDVDGSNSISLQEIKNIIGQ